MKQFYRTLLAMVTLFTLAFQANAIGWPANYQGVMLQGFYWDSYNDSKWTALTEQADEISQYFSLVWIPNAGRSAGMPSMGYAPVYWFTNFNSSFGNEAQLREMIATYKAKGTGIIYDVVINHRAGTSNWYNFPAETWNGTTYRMGLSDICSNDEMAYATGQPRPTGNPDTGENFDGYRDLDHTKSNVQENCKAFCKFLLTDLGVAGFRLDMVKGYGAQYTKIYNQYSQPQFCVGEYWDGSYDALAAWIEGTGKTSAAFDFAFKYAVNDAFHSGNYSKLVWQANGQPQPAGLIHNYYQQYAVTFIDNHDTGQDGNSSKFNGNVLAANAFMICSPGTPCVFYKHWKQHKAEIAKMIAVRNACGITNTSSVKVLETNNSCYMAEVTGSKGKLVVKIGPSMSSPSGYSNSDIKASGTDYCIWSKANVGGVEIGPSVPSKLYLMGDLQAGHWKTNVGVAMTKSGNKYTAKNVNLVANTGETKAFFSFVTALGSTGANSEWDEVINASDRYGATSNDLAISVGTATPIQCFQAGVDAPAANSWGVAPGSYDVTVDFDANTVKLVAAGTVVEPEPNPNPNPGDDGNLYLVGEFNDWTVADAAYKFTKNASTYTISVPSLNGEFKIVGSSWNLSFGGDTGGEDVPTTPATIGTNSMWLGSSVNLVANSWSNVTISFSWDGSAENIQVNIAANGGTTPDNPSSGFDIYWDNTSAGWATPKVHYWGGSESTWPGVAMTKVSGNTWKYTVPAGTTGLVFNDGNGSQTDDFVAVANHIYNMSGDQGVYSGSTTPDIPGDGAELYLVGEFNDWKEGDAAYKFTKNASTYTISVPSLNGEFKIVGSSWNLSFGGDTGGENVPSVPAILGENSMWKGSSVNLVADNWTNVTISFSWDGTEDHIFVTISTGGQVTPPTPPTPGEYPAVLYLIGHVNGTSWSTTASIAHHSTSEAGVYHWNNITVDDAGDGHGYVSFVTRQASDWDGTEDEPGVNAADRFGASTQDEMVTIGNHHAITLFAAEIDASSAHSWKVPVGKYNFTADLKNMQLTVTNAASGIEDVEVDAADAVYYNLQGARVMNPQKGIYIEVRGGIARKVAK